MSFEIVYANETYISSLREAIDSVARENIYFDMIEAPSTERLREFMNGLVEKNAPFYLAVANKQIIGWCDISPESSPRRSHRGKLAIGVRAEFRGIGVGSSLLRQAIEHAKKIGLKKIELTVFSQNEKAIALYRHHGFESEGLRRDYRRHEGVSYDGLLMAKFI